MSSRCDNRRSSHLLTAETIQFQDFGIPQALYDERQYRLEEEEAFCLLYVLFFPCSHCIWQCCLERKQPKKVSSQVIYHLLTQMVLAQAVEELSRLQLQVEAFPAA